MATNLLWLPLSVSGSMMHTQVKNSNLLTGHTDSVDSIAFSPDGKMFATGSDDNTVLLWDADTGERKATLILA